MRKKIFPSLFVLFLGLQFLAFNTPAYAYYSNMSASIVIGQSDFISNSANQGGSASASTLNLPTSAIKIGSKFLVSDFQNHRILIYNSVPIRNNPTADVVIGQQNFSGTSANQGGSAGANTLKFPSSLSTDGTKIFVTDEQNNRVLIFNQVPTSNNTSADVVIGQTSMTSASGGTTSSTVSFPFGIFYDSSSGKLVVSEYGSNRVLIFNSIPTSNGAIADVVVGQSNFTGNSINQGGSPSANTLNRPEHAIIANGKLIVSDSENNRILIWNSVPTSNNTSADVVIGQTNFNSNSANQGGSAAANTFNLAGPVAYDGKRLFIVDRSNNRTLIFNGVPTTNNASADVVIGQTNFTGNSVNQGNGSSNAQGQNGAFGVFLIDNSLYLGDTSNNRVLIFNNILSTPAMNINSPINLNNGNLRIQGNIQLGERPNYSMQKVTASINGQTEGNVTSLDGGRDNGPGSSLYEFSEDFNPTINFGDSNNFVVSFRAQSFNADEDKVFYFTPFSFDKINQISNTDTDPSFSFSVNSNFPNQMKNNITKYQIFVKKSSDPNSFWSKYVDNIPVDFDLVKLDPSNQQAFRYASSLANSDGNYETNNFLVNYSNFSSKITVKSKTPLTPGTYTVQIKAINIMNHEQQSNNLTLNISKRQIPQTNFVISTPTPTPQPKAEPTPVPVVSSPLPTATPKPKTCFLFWCW